MSGRRDPLRIEERRLDDVLKVDEVVGVVAGDELAGAAGVGGPEEAEANAADEGVG